MFYIFLKVLLKCRRSSNTDYLIGKYVSIPKIISENITEYFTNSGLARDNKRRIVMSSFKRSKAKGFADGTHNEYIGDVIRITPLFAAYETCKEQFIGDTKFSTQPNKFIALFTVSRE